MVLAFLSRQATGGRGPQPACLIFRPRTTQKSGMRPNLQPTELNRGFQGKWEPNLRTRSLRAKSNPALSTNNAPVFPESGTLLAAMLPVTCSDQLSRVPMPTGEVSAMNSVQTPFGFDPSKLSNRAVPGVPSKVPGAVNGLTLRPSGRKAPVRSPPV